MLSTSKDLLFIVIAFCVLWLTAFTCWMLYYIIMIFHGIKGKSDKIDDILNMIKNKLERPAAYLPLIVEGVKELINFIKERKRDEEETKDEKKKR